MWFHILHCQNDYIYYMKPPANTELFEGELATFWIDEHGILCAISKSASRSLEKQKKNYEFIRQITGDKKICLLSDTTTSSPQDKETRDYTATQLPLLFNAMAIVSDSIVGRFTTNVFLALKQQPIPIKFFSNEEDARKWLLQYL
jgi:hypothetical protein